MSAEDKAVVNSVMARITYEEKEVMQVLRSYLGHHIALKWMSVVFGAVILAMIINGFWKGFSEFDMLCIVSFISVYIVYYWICYGRLIQSYKKFYKSRKGGMYTFFEDEVNVVSDELQCTYKWTMYKKCVETPMAFILEDENRFIYIILKSCFANEDDRLKLSNLIKGQIKVYDKIQ